MKGQEKSIPWGKSMETELSFDFLGDRSFWNPWIVWILHHCQIEIRDRHADKRLNIYHFFPAFRRPRALRRERSRKKDARRYIRVVSTFFVDKSMAYRSAVGNWPVHRERKREIELFWFSAYWGSRKIAVTTAITKYSVVSVKSNISMQIST